MKLSWRPGRYLRNSGVLFGWMAIRVATQAAMVLVLSRTLGATDYGRFVSVIAVASFLGPFAGLGLSAIILRDIARDGDASHALMRSALRIWAWSTAVAAPGGAVLAWLMLPADLPWAAVSAAVVADIISTSLTELIAREQQARHRTATYGAMVTGLPLLRVATLLLYLALGQPSLGGWLWLHAVAGLGYAAALAWRRLRRQGLGSGRVLHVKEGLPFAVATLSMRLQAEFNKPVLARAGFDMAGQFSAAQRAVEMASLPLLALQEALWPRVYAALDSKRSSRLQLMVLASVGAAIGTVVWFLAPLVPHVLGNSFRGSVEVLQWLAWLPILQLVRNATNVYSTKRLQTHAIAWSYTISAAVAVIATLVLVPRLGAAGAVVVAYTVELVTIAVQWCLVNLRTPQREPIGSPDV